jgi:hypothetical protein
MSNTNNKPTIFLDNIGRSIIGKILKEDDTFVSVENPALVHVSPNPQTNQLQLQILPLFFREFQQDRTLPTTWNFRKVNIVMSEPIEFSEQFVAQYTQMFAPPQPQPENNPEVIKLFDEEEKQ